MKYSITTSEFDSFHFNDEHEFRKGIKIELERVIHILEDNGYENVNFYIIVYTIIERYKTFGLIPLINTTLEIGSYLNKNMISCGWMRIDDTEGNIWTSDTYMNAFG